MAWNSIRTPLATYRAERAAGTTEKSAELAAIRDAVAVGLQRCLGPLGLQQAFGHAAGAIGTKYPFALTLWETPTTPTLGYTPADGGPGDYLDASGGEIEEEVTLAIIIAVGPLAPDIARLQALAEIWEVPLFFFVSENPTLADTVSHARWAGFSLETLPYGDTTTYYCAVAHIRCTLIR